MQRHSMMFDDEHVAAIFGNTNESPLIVHALKCDTVSKDMKRVKIPFGEKEDEVR